MKLTMLGCGGSGGVPLAGRDPGGYWGNADPANTKNRRSRVSVLIEGRAGEGSPGGDTTRILIDTSPDLRQQILANGITALDRSEEHTSEHQSLMRISYAVFC